MTTSHSSKRSGFAGWVLDLHGKSYGDERERMHRYEGIVVASTAQSLFFSVVLAVIAWFAPKEATWVLVVVGLAFSLPMYLVLPYLSRRKVDAIAPLTSRKGISKSIVFTVPWLIFSLGLGYSNRHKKNIDLDYFKGTAVGALLSFAILAGVMIGLSRKKAKSVGGLSDSELD